MASGAQHIEMEAKGALCRWFSTFQRFSVHRSGFPNVRVASQFDFRTRREQADEGDSPTKCGRFAVTRSNDQLADDAVRLPRSRSDFVTRAAGGGGG